MARGKGRVQHEHTLQQAVFQWAAVVSNPMHRKLLRTMFSIDHAGTRHVSYGRALKQRGVKAGVPDIFLPVPVPPYHGLWIELKSPRGSVSPEQREFQETLRSLGYAVAVCRTLEDVQSMTMTYLQPTARWTCYPAAKAERTVRARAMGRLCELHPPTLRNIAVVRITREAIPTLLRGGWVTTNLPEDTRVLGVDFDPTTSNLLFFIESPELASVGDGAQYPWFELKVALQDQKGPAHGDRSA